MLKILVIPENSTNGFTKCTTSHPREGFYFFDDLVCYMYTTTATVMPYDCLHALTGDESQVKSTVAKTKNKEMGNQHLLSPSHLTHFLYRSTYLLLYYYADSWKKIGIISKRIGYH